LALSRKACQPALYRIKCMNIWSLYSVDKDPLWVIPWRNYSLVSATSSGRKIIYNSSLWRTNLWEILSQKSDLSFSSSVILCFIPDICANYCDIDVKSFYFF
jgi:hypothetical protein